MVGGDLEGVDKDRSNGVGMWGDVQSSDTDIYDLQKIKLGGDGVNVEDPVSVSPPGIQTYCGDDRKTCGRKDMGISPSGCGARSSGLIPYLGVYYDMIGDHHFTGGMPPHL